MQDPHSGIFEVQSTFKVAAMQLFAIYVMYGMLCQCDTSEHFLQYACHNSSLGEDSKATAKHSEQRSHSAILAQQCLPGARCCWLTALVAW